MVGWMGKEKDGRCSISRSTWSESRIDATSNHKQSSAHPTYQHRISYWCLNSSAPMPTSGELPSDHRHQPRGCPAADIATYLTRSTEPARKLLNILIWLTYVYEIPRCDFASGSWLLSGLHYACIFLNRMYCRYIFVKASVSLTTPFCWVIICRRCRTYCSDIDSWLQHGGSIAAADCRELSSVRRGSGIHGSKQV